jgi:hypothetical protein
MHDDIEVSWQMYSCTASMQVVAARPSLLGLDVEENLKEIVGYLQSREEYSQEDILKFLKTTL